MASPRPRTGRVEYKNGHGYYLDGRKVSGSTTIIKGGLPSPALINWAPKKVAEYVVENIGEVVDLVATRSADTAIYDLKNVPWRDRDLAANRGTEVHRYAEAIVLDEPLDDPPEEIHGHIEQLARFLEEWRPTFDMVECVVASREHGYMGTFDFLGHIPGLGRVLGDWKTNRSGIFSEVALQLASYRYAEFIVGPDGTEIPMPKVDQAVAIHITADNYDVVPVATGRAVFESFLDVKRVFEFTKRMSDLIGEPLFLDDVA